MFRLLLRLGCYNGFFNVIFFVFYILVVEFFEVEDKKDLKLKLIVVKDELEEEER